jgi:hypothetical protein
MSTKNSKKNLKMNDLKPWIKRFGNEAMMLGSSESWRNMWWMIWKLKTSGTTNEMSAIVKNKVEENELTKTSKTKNVNVKSVDTSGRNDMFKVGKAGEDVWAAF